MALPRRDKVIVVFQMLSSACLTIVIGRVFSAVFWQLLWLADQFM
jgi:hypothetical protein